METNSTKTPQQYTEEAFWTGHYHYLLQALAIAINSCLVWRLAATGQPFTADDLFRFAKEYDEQHPLEKEAFYMVSREGAIGLAPGLEYMVKWMFLPMERGVERDRLLQQLQQIMAQQQAEEEATQSKVTQPSPRFCTNCGAPLIAGNKFCTHCGTKVG